VTGPADRPVAIEAIGLTRVYGSGPTAVRALDGVDLVIPAGEFVALLGPSGSGKTTLLNLVGGIDRPTDGRVVVGGVDVTALDRAGLGRFRREQVSFVFQFFNLIPTLTAVENVELVAGLTGADRDHSEAALTDVGLAAELDRFPSQLSGGQQQRVAVARALAKSTPVLLADEPTGALDRASGDEVLALLRRACDEHGRTVLVVTHDHTVAAMADRVINLVDGAIAGDRLVDDPVAPADRGGG
jgi:putative ABC transport system ATP-binding protein